MLGNLTPVVSLKDATKYIKTSLSSNEDTVTYLLVDMSASETPLSLEDCLAMNDNLSTIDNAIASVYGENYVSVFTASTPVDSFTYTSTNGKYSFSSPDSEISRRRNLLLTQGITAAAKPVMYTGLYITPDIATFLIIFGFLVAMYGTGLGLLFSVQSNQGFEVQPPPVGKEM